MRSLAIGIGVAIASIGFSDTIPTEVRVPGWKISSSESLWVGSKGPSYPLWQLIDSDPTTTWRYSGKDYPKPAEIDGIRLNGDYFIVFQPDSPVAVDEISIVNGYGKSQDLFHKNSRVASVQILDHVHYRDETQADVNRATVKRFTLQDSTSPQSIKLKSKRYKAITVRIAGITKGSVDDLCISEIDLRFKGKSVLHRSNLLVYTKGDECGCGGTGTLLSWSGKLVAKLRGESNYNSSFNPSGSRFAAVDGDQLWVADVNSAKIVKCHRTPKGTFFESWHWISDHKLLVHVQDKTGKVIRSTVWKV